MQTSASILERVRGLNVYRRGDKRAPHKPLLLLVAIGRLLAGKRVLDFDEARERLEPLLKVYAPPVRARHQPELPYWHLRSDGLWVVPGDAELPRQKGGFPRIEALRGTAGFIPDDIADALVADPGLRDRVVKSLLDLHFPPSLHEDILQV